MPVDQVLVAFIECESSAVSFSTWERVCRDLNSRADPADQIERRLNGVAVNAEAVQAHEVDSTGSRLDSSSVTFITKRSRG